MTWLMLAAGDAPWWKATLVQVFGFVVLLGILIKFVVPLLRNILGGRTKAIEDAFAKAEKETADAARELAELKAKLARLEEESRARHAAAMADAEKTRAQALADARAQAEAVVDKARREIGIERDKAVLDLRQEVEELTLAAADHLVQAAMTDAIHQKLMEDYLGRIEGATRT